MIPGLVMFAYALRRLVVTGLVNASTLMRIVIPGLVMHSGGL